MHSPMNTLEARRERLVAIMKTSGPGDGNPIGWIRSGLRRVAHYIRAEDEYLIPRCGVEWWASDTITGRLADGDTPRCKRCERIVKQ